LRKILISKLENQNEMEVLSNQSKLLDRGVLIEVVKKQSELYFDTNPDVIKRYGLELNSFVLRQPNYSFVYVISFIITFFIFIIFIYIKESAKKYLKNKND
jgi:hypothetical protein